MKKNYFAVSAGIICILLLGACGNRTQAMTGNQTTAQTAASTESAAMQQTGDMETAALQTAASDMPYSQNNGEITEEEAKAIALEHAGLTGKDVQYLKAELDMDDGRRYYEIDFYDDGIEYDYKINAATGEIAAYDCEADNNADRDVEPENAIGKEKSMDLALEKAGMSRDKVTGLHADFDMDNGRAEYEVIFYEGKTEYDVTIDALTGEIIGFEKERD